MNIMKELYDSFISNESPPSSTSTSIKKNKDLDVPNSQSDLWIGAGIYDITGPAAEVGMFGYAKAGQLTSGIHMRLRARSFAFESRRYNSTRNEKNQIQPLQNKIVSEHCVYVIADLGMISEWVKQTVVERLNQDSRIPKDTYTTINVMISATHTHCSPGGLSHYLLYSVHPPLSGADKQNFECVVNGIVESIVRAYCNRQPAIIRVATGLCLGASVNRSEDAYIANPQSEREKYKYNTDKTMTLWRIDGVNGFPIGMINWFAVHPTSMGSWYTLITGDNKGYAAHVFEKEHGTNHLMDKPRAFVAAFAQTNEGDVSPNICGPRNSTTQHKDFERMLIVAEAQLTTARHLYETALQSPAITRGNVSYTHQYVEYGNIHLRDRWYKDKDCLPTTSSGCIGLSMIGGTTFDGKGLAIIPEGLTWGSTFPKVTTLPDLQAQQKEKLVFLPTARYGLSPTILPLQIFLIGDCLPIVATPFEITTMAGRRIRDAVEQAFQETLPIMEKVDETWHLENKLYTPVISGLSNAYCGYMTTREEYSVQRYEGASTHFGPNQLNATCQQLEILVHVLIKNRIFQRLIASNDDSDNNFDAKHEFLQKLSLLQYYNTEAAPQISGFGRWDYNFPVFHDGLLPNASYGSVTNDSKVLSEYRPGTTVTVSMHAAHPKNNLRTQGTFLEVHRWIPSRKKSSLNSNTSNNDNGANLSDPTLNLVKYDEKAEGTWVIHADDGDASTFFHWQRVGTFASVVTIEWCIPNDTPLGTYRIKVNGDYKGLFTNEVKSYYGYSGTFQVVSKQYL